MGLITKEVEVKLCGSNISYYESLGYEIPRYFNKKSKKYVVKKGTTLLVKVEHLPLSSNVVLDVECDCCKTPIKKSYNDYNRRLHDGKSYCRKCAMVILNSGENNCNYNSNLTYEEREKRREYPEYIEFVKGVMARDNYICQCCGEKATDVHHLYGYSCYPEYRTDQTQALSLCEMCHKSFHNWHYEKYGYINRGNCTREQYEDWIGHALETLKKYNGVLPSARKIYDYESGIVYNNASECANTLKAQDTKVYQCCNHKIIINRVKLPDGNVRLSKTIRYTVKGHHLFWLDEYKNMTQDELQQFLKNNKSKNKGSLNNESFIMQ